MDQLGTFAYSPILGGDFQRLTAGVTLRPATGVYLVGSVLTLSSTDGLCQLATKTDTLFGILADEMIDTGDATKTVFAGEAWITGEFERARLIFGAGTTWQDMQAAAQDKSIFFKDAAIQPNG
jgi:hypothetical protein